MGVPKSMEVEVPGANPADLWEFSGVDMAKVAEAIGAYGTRVDQPGGIRSALEQALAPGRPAGVGVATDPLDSEAPTTKEGELFPPLCLIYA